MMSADHKRSIGMNSGMIEKCLIALSGAGTVLFLSWLFRYSAHGFDFTDESLYLVWIATPFLYDGSISQFGFVYHPLHRLLGGDVALLRQANVLITFALAWGLVLAFLPTLAAGMPTRRIALPVVSAALATSSFTLFESWLLTPSYNSLNGQALLIAATGVVLAGQGTDRRSVLGWLLIGVGGWLTFMAKPSSALALAIGVFLCLLAGRKLSVRMLALSVATALALLILGAMLIDGSIAGFLARLDRGLDTSRYLGGGHTLGQILRIDDFRVDERLRLALVAASVALVIAVWGLSGNRKLRPFIGLAASAAFFAITASLALGLVNGDAGFGSFQGLLIFAAVFAIAISALALGRLRMLRGISAEQWAVAAFLMVLPHVFAFGSSVNYWQAGSSAGIFWLLAALTLLGPMLRERNSWLLVLPVALAAQAVTATLLQTGFEKPYRQPQSLRQNTATLEIGLGKSALVLTEDYAAYLSAAMSAARDGGFEPGTPVIDMSGQSPGVLFAIGAENIGQAWMIGGYPGSLKLAQAMLARTSCDSISKAWILFEQDGPRSIPTELMPGLGADFPAGYKRVGTWQTAIGAGGYPERRTQDLYKPLEPHNTLTTCRKLREETEP